MLMRRCGGAFF